MSCARSTSAATISRSYRYTAPKHTHTHTLARSLVIYPIIHVPVQSDSRPVDSDLTPLRDFVKLETLVLDGNKLTSHSKIPRLPALKTLWVNKNRIGNLSIFIDQLVEAVPNLRYLSMMNNDACPNFFNGGSLKQYQDYRYTRAHTHTHTHAHARVHTPLNHWRSNQPTNRYIALSNVRSRSRSLSCHDGVT